jgi:rhamnulokinase
VRSIVESLAEGFARALTDAASLSGRSVSVVHVVGGGAQNSLLCRALADRVGLPVVAGPVEATALGNVLVQARALGELIGDLEVLRDLVARTTEPVTYTPGGRR